MATSYLELYSKRGAQAAPKKQKKHGLFGLDLPNLGVGQAVKELGAIPGGLLRLGTSLAPGGEAAGHVWSGFGKGMASSLAGTAINVLDVAEGGKGFAAEPLRDAVGSVLGETYRPKSFSEMYRERGILGPAIETIGNVAIGAGVAGKLAKAGDVGRLAGAESAATHAAEAGFSTADINAAADAARQGHGFGLRHQGFKDAGIADHTLRAAGKAVERADGAVADATDVAARTKTVNRLYATAHPYRSLYEKLLSPVTREAHARSITGAKAPTPPADLAPDRAASLIENAMAGASEADQAGPPLDEFYAGEGGGAPASEGGTAVATLPDQAVNPAAFIDDSARAYAQAHGLPEPTAVDTTAQVDPVRGRIVANLYKGAVSDPENPAVQQAYNAFAQDVVNQYQHLKQQGVDIQFVDRQGAGAYPDATSMIDDVRNNGRLVVDRTGADEAHLMPVMNEVIDTDAAGNPVTVNDAFRAVHDYFGHSRASNVFDRHGEDVAWRLHEQMFSPEAKPALFTETVGQNSYLNFDPENVAGGALGRQGKFPDQKAAILPDYVRDPEFRPGQMGPAEQASRLVATQPGPEWAAKIVDRLPDPAVRALYAVDRRLDARRAGAVIKEHIRLQDIDRRKVLHGEAVRAARDAAEQHLVGRTLPDGTLVVPEVADSLVGDTIIARLDLTDALEKAIGDGATPEQATALREAMVKHQLRSEQRIPETWLTDTDGTPTALGEAVNEAVVKMRGANADRLDVLRSTRKGDKGLEHVEDTTPALSPKAQRLLARATRDVATAEKLEQTRIPREIARTERRIQAVGDQITKLGRQIQDAEEAGRSAVRDFDLTRKYVPPALREGAWPKAIDTIVAETLDNAGASFDPHENRLLQPVGQGGQDTGFAVGATRGTAKAIQLTGQKQTDAVALAEGVDHVARAYQDLLQNPRVILGTWVDDANTAHIDVSEIVPTRDEALLKAAARGQDSIYDLSKGLDDAGAFPVPAGRADVAVEFLQRSHQRTRYGTQLRRTFDAINAERGRKGLDPLVTTDDIDAQMAVNDLLAVNASRVMPEKFKTPDAYYAKLAVSARKSVSNPAALFERVLGKDLNPELIDEALATVPNADRVMEWYQRTHDTVAARYRKPDGTPYRITLGNGKVVEVPDLIHQLIAVTSIQQTPAVNLGDALNAIANYQRIVTTGDEGVGFWTKLMDDFLATPAKDAEGKGNAASPRTLTDLFERAIKPAEGTTVHRYWTARFPVIEVLNGNTLDTWGDINPETGKMYVEERQGLAGSKPKPIDRAKALQRLDPDVVAQLGEDRAVMEYYGQLAFAKIRSFYDNLRDPAGSNAVTLDMWMARLLGADTKLDLMKPGTYLQYANEMRDLSGVLSERLGRSVKPHELQALLWAYAMNETHKALLDEGGYATKVGEAGKRIMPIDWRDFADHLADPTPRLQTALDAVDGMAGDTFFQKAKGHILGAMVAGDTRNLMYFFEGANPVTLAHENAHALRQILGEDDMAVLERAYKVDKGTWGRAHEERFAHDFETYLATREAPTPGLSGYFARIASVLGDAWRFIRGQHLNSDVSELLDRWLNPAEKTIADADVLPEFAPLDSVKERMVDGVYTQAERSQRQRAQGAPAVPELSTQEAYRRGVKGGEALAAQDAAAKKAAELEGRKVRLQKNLDTMQRSLIESRLDSQVLAQRFRSRAQTALEKVAQDLEQPGMTRTPPAWQPLWSAVRKLHEEAQSNPDLAALLEDVPEQWSTVLRIAQEQGFDPTHIRSFQPSEVRQLVYGNVKLGRRGRDLGQTIEAGTRKLRRGATARTRSLDALAAASIEATHEMHTNAVADFIEQTYARPVENGTIPDGYVGWDAERSFLLTGERGSDGTVTVNGMGAPTKMVPKEVKAVLDSYQRDFSHSVFQNLRKVLDPWRLFVLTLSPRWYVNNIAGNVMLASKEGVKLEDWASAWRSYRKGGSEHLTGNLRQRLGAGSDSFGDALGAIEGSVVSETGEGGLVRYPQGREGLKLAKSVSKGEALKVGAARLRRANEVVDEIARVAVYKKALREGASESLALKRTYEALVDYNDLSPFERQVVRSVVPFYAWQKGILKLVAKYPVDHPMAAGIMMNFAGIQQQLSEDYYGGKLPDAYASIMPIPILGNVNTRAINPFQDASTLTTPQGIAASMNPFLESALRNALGAPQGGFADRYRIDEFGSRVPDTSPAVDATDIITGLPQFRFGESLTGTSLSGIPPKSRTQGTGSFAGVPAYTDEQVRAMVERLLKSQKRQAGSR